MHNYLAVDLGAESGRVIRGTLADDRLELEEIARFPTGMDSDDGHFYWNLSRILGEIIAGLKAAGDAGMPIEGVGVDSWGVDFVLLGADGEPTGRPVAYRDHRTDGMMEKCFERIVAEKIYGKTGIQFLPFNTLYQLLALSEAGSEELAAAESLLMIPDFLHYRLTGKACSEFSNATTSQCFNIHENAWDAEILEAVGVSPAIMQDVVQPGTEIGRLTGDMQKATGLGEIPVIAPATHDTGSAVAAVPAEGENWAYISSGTWSLMGIEIDHPITTEASRKFNFTNEGGVHGTIRLLKNIMGMWLIQQCRAGFDTEYAYADLTQQAAEATAFVSLIDPDDGRFLNPPSMPEAIAEFCRETDQPVCDSPGAFIRCCLESLALQYRCVLEELRQVQDMPIDRIHIIGGGIQNKLLCQFAADATGLPVLAGPVEASAIGNLVVQAEALGHIASHAEARKLIRRSFEITEYTPRQSDSWEDAWWKFQTIKEKA
ncbi:MAG: rhamnulokinase [Phycisphaerae bacterium]|nr:rhamnulokinase [Phycisphaerae bacterium]